MSEIKSGLGWLRITVLSVACGMFIGCGADKGNNERTLRSVESAEGFDFSFDLTSDDSKRLVSEHKSIECIVPMDGSSKDSAVPSDLCDDFLEFRPKVLIEVTLHTKYDKKWTKRSKKVELGYEGTVVFKKIKKGSKGIRVSLRLLDIIEDHPEPCSGLYGEVEFNRHESYCEPPECDAPIPMAESSSTGNKIAFEGCDVMPVGDEGFTVIDLPEFGFDTPSGEAKIPGLVDGDVRNISAKM